MTIDSELMQKRQEVRDEILVLIEHIPSARIFNWLGRAFRHSSLGYWISNVVLLYVILFLPWTIIGITFNETKITGLVTKASITNVLIIVPSIFIAHVAAQIMLRDIANRVIEKITNIDDLTKLILWIKKTWSRQGIFAFTIIFTIIWVVLGAGSMSVVLGRFVGFGLTITATLVGILASMVFYVLVWTTLMVINLKDYQYEMNNLAPADSEIITTISEILNKGIYILAVFFAAITLIATSNLINPQIRVALSLPVILLGWALIILQFFLTRSTLGTITNRAKWKTLNRIKEKINAIEATGDLSDKDVAERLFRLVDIHKQIIVSKTNTLDWKSVSTLFSQLMLPLLGLLLGNLDKLLKLLP